MTKSNYFLFVLLVITCTLVWPCSGLIAQTSGNLSFTVNLKSHSGGYGYRHVSAIWIEDVSHSFVKTKYRMAAGHTLNSHLPVWKANSNSNVIDATTGPTLTAYSAITVGWNATNVSASVVPDGIYRVLVEFTWDDGSSNHDTTSVVFSKGSSAVHLTPADRTNFTGTTLAWIPSNVGITDHNTKETFSIYPNPVTSQSVIQYSLNDLSDVTISLYDLSGKLVNVILDENQDAGNYSIPFAVSGKLKPGMYIVKMYTGKTQDTKRILISE